MRIVGWAAAVMMLSAYVLLTMGRLSARSKAYHWLNVLSGVGFIVNSGWNGAYPSAFINVVWALIGLYGVFGHSIVGSKSTAREVDSCKSKRAYRDRRGVFRKRI